MDSLNHRLSDNKFQIRIDTNGVEPLKPNLVPLLTALATADYLSVHQKIDMLGLEKPIGEDVYILTRSAKVVKDLKEAPTPTALEVPNAAPITPAAPAA
ncbi:hypothetical protein [Hymenobacter sp. UYCo722]|uniref:hypothetical protein n=1 Tax=Hymenobacter sp. UYCo722 TaxID=3156335 RepID=UPI003395E88D